MDFVRRENQELRHAARHSEEWNDQSSEPPSRSLVQESKLKLSESSLPKRSSGKPSPRLVSNLQEEIVKLQSLLKESSKTASMQKKDLIKEIEQLKAQNRELNKMLERSKLNPPENDSQPQGVCSASKPDPTDAIVTVSPDGHLAESCRESVFWKGCL